MNRNSTEKPDPFEHLYVVPLEVFKLSEEAHRSLVNSGVDTIGDCLSFYVHCKYAMVSVSSDGMQLMFGEVKEKLIEHGYWSYVEDDSE